MAVHEPTAWVPDGRPTRSDVIVTGLVAILLGQRLLAPEPLHWRWVAVGFGTFALAMGPGAASSTGQRIGTWFRGLGVAGRSVLILAFVVVVVLARVTLTVPWARAASAALGGLVAVLVFLLARAGVWLASRG